MRASDNAEATFPGKRLFHKGKGGGDVFHAADLAGGLRRRLSFLLRDQTQQEHFTIFGGDFHIG
ncbi:hypothetical protein D3C80_1877070 [compost metagenome]